MKPTPAADEMFSEGVGTYMDDDMVAGGIIVDSNREGVHADFNNGKAQDFVTSCELEELFSDFGDLFDDEDLA